jgi:hypothetical protein
VSADQPPTTPPADPEAEPGTDGGVPQRLFFPEEPAVPAPAPRPGGSQPGSESWPGPPPPGQAPPGPPLQGQAPPGRPLQGQAPSPGQAPHPGQAPPPGQAQYPGQAPPPYPGQAPPPGQAPFRGQPPRPGQPPRGTAQPRRPRPTAPPRRELRQRALAASIFGLISLFALSAAGEVKHALYLVVFSFAVAVLAIVAGASAGRRARREQTARPRGSLAAIILGSAAIFLCAVSLVAIVFATQFSNYETCISNAPSSAAKQACAQQFMQAVQKKIDGSSQPG